MTVRARRARRGTKVLHRYLPAGSVRRTLLLSAIALVTLGATASGAAAQLNVYVGYADNKRVTPTHFPTPWAPSVKVYGTKCSPKHACDTSTLRLVNNSSKTVTVTSVVVKFSTCTFNSWPHNLKIRAGRQIVLSSEGRRGMKGCSKKINGFDGSEIGPHGQYWNGHCNQSHVIPQVFLTTSAGKSKFRDSAQVLNSGGFDKAKCGKKKRNESSQWSLIGRQACPSAMLTLAPASQKDAVGTNAKLTATLKNSGGRHCGQPLRGEKVTLRVLSGPNKGKTVSAVTNKSGKASFAYTGTKKGTDQVQATAKNPAGGFRSKKAKVIWTKSSHHHHGGHRAGTFSCRATGANVLGATFAIANPKDSPCAAHQASVLKVGPIKAIKTSANVIRSNTFKKYGTTPKAGDTAEATSKVAKATVGVLHLKIGAVSSSATDTCVAKGGKLALKQTGKSTVAYIMVNGKKTVIGSKSQTLNLGIATIYFNRTIKSGNTLTQRAVEIDLGGTTPSVILAQSEVDYTGNPCATA